MLVNFRYFWSCPWIDCHHSYQQVLQAWTRFDLELIPKGIEIPSKEELKQAIFQVWWGLKRMTSKNHAKQDKPKPPKINSLTQFNFFSFNVVKFDFISTVEFWKLLELFRRKKVFGNVQLKRKYIFFGILNRDFLVKGDYLDLEFRTNQNRSWI